MAVKYYAVRKGIKPGIYKDWNTCKAMVTGFSGAQYKSFTTLQEAEAYIKEDAETAQAGKEPEVYGGLRCRSIMDTKSQGIILTKCCRKALGFSCGDIRQLF